MKRLLVGTYAGYAVQTPTYAFVVFVVVVVVIVVVVVVVVVIVVETWRLVPLEKDFPSKR